MSHVPLNDKILVQKIEEEETQVNGIIVPGSDKLPVKGLVLAVSKTLEAKEEFDVKVGDTVTFYKGHLVPLDTDQTTGLVLEEALLSKVSNE